MTENHNTAPRVTGIDLLLILLVTVSWGMNYPVMKFVVTNYPPSSFRAWTFLLGALSIALYALIRNESLALPRTERWLVFKLSLGNMVFWHLGLIYGLVYLSSGRAAIVGYTMPVWALLASVIFYKERLTGSALLGVVFALSATLLLAMGDVSNLTGQPLGIALMLFAALTWGIGIAMMRHSRLAISSVVLNFWNLLIAFFIFSALAWYLERDAWRWPNSLEWLAICYGGIVTFAISYVAWFRVARKLSPATSGLSIMLVPVFGVFGGALVLGEEISWLDIAALLLILSAMSVVLLPARSRRR
ncbi:MAG: DMT family transporter [Burkholderiaceae bacterium]